MSAETREINRRVVWAAYGEYYVLSVGLVADSLVVIDKLQSLYQ